ncbi:MAG: Phospholipid ABC transporter permease protein MlaE, partial [uncultured Gemmatimonadaceae bacterium]
ARPPRVTEHGREGARLHAAGVLHARVERAALHLRAAVLRRRSRAADERAGRAVARHRPAHGLLHRHGAGAAVVGAARDVRRHAVHRPPRGRVDHPRARPGAGRADGRRPRGLGDRRADRLDAGHRADRRAQHAGHGPDQEAGDAARARAGDHAADPHRHQRLRRHPGRERDREPLHRAPLGRVLADGVGADRRRRLLARLHPERLHPGAVQAVRLRPRDLRDRVLLRPLHHGRHRGGGRVDDAHGGGGERRDPRHRLLPHADPAVDLHAV